MLLLQIVNVYLYITLILQLLVYNLIFFAKILMLTFRYSDLIMVTVTSGFLQLSLQPNSRTQQSSVFFHNEVHIKNTFHIRIIPSLALLRLVISFNHQMEPFWLLKSRKITYIGINGIASGFIDRESTASSLKPLDAPQYMFLNLRF